MSEQRLDLYIEGEPSENEARAVVLQQLAANNWYVIPGTVKDYRFHHNDMTGLTYVGLTFQVMDGEEQEAYSEGFRAYNEATRTITNDGE